MCGVWDFYIRQICYKFNTTHGKDSLLRKMGGGEERKKFKDYFFFLYHYHDMEKPWVFKKLKYILQISFQLKGNQANLLIFKKNK